MVVVGVLVSMLGTGFTIVVLVTLALRAQRRLLLRRLRAATRVSCADLTSRGRLPGMVLMTGTMAPGPAGLLRSPAYDRPCVWFRTGVLQYDPTPPEIGSSDYRRRAFFRRESGGPVSLTDPSGTVLFDMALVRQDGDYPPLAVSLTEDAKLSVAHRADQGSAMARLEGAGLLPGSLYGLVVRRMVVLREQFIEPGRRLTVLARPRRTADGAVILGRRGALSTEEPDTWRNRLEDAAVSDAVLLRLFPISLVTLAVGVAITAVGIG